MTRVDVVGLSVAYDSVPALSGVSLRVPEASWIGVIGPNGAGKSTLLRAIAGLVGPRGGEVRLDGAALSSLSRRSLSRLVAYVPQRPVLPEGMTVTDYVLLGRTPYIGYLGMEGRSDLGVVGNVLERLELRHFAGRVLGSLSGGEVQRVVLGRALAQQAPVLLLDEPTAALDIGHAQQVLELIEELRSEHRLTVISSMHDLTLAGQFAERLILLAGGRVVAGGPARGVLTEATIWQHYGASVRVLTDRHGRVGVLPVRSRAEDAATGVQAGLA